MSKARNRSLWRRTITAIAVSLALGPALAAAQPGPMGPPAGPPGPGPHLHQMLQQLNLTTDQRASIDTILAAHRNDRGVDREKMMAARRTLVAKINAESFDEAGIRQAAAAIAALEAERAVATATLLHEIRAVLDPDQQKQLQEQLNQPPPMRGERGPHRSGPGRPFGSRS